ncbi:MAG: glycosyltransferase family 4 protein [Pseudomonadales bacterium]|nr:glycosyltransferase family 4 protein [Pseudomonadales bacterium]
MRIIWINDHADFTGGCEQYIYQTVKLMNAMGIESSLLYRVGGPVNVAFIKVFKAAFPMVEVHKQVEVLNADLIYLHRLDNIRTLQQLIGLPIKTVRFFHDHKLFCLREHKYTTLRHQPCEKKVGLNCYSCLGFVNKTERGIGLRSVSQLNREIALNRQLDYFVVGSRYMAEHLQLHDFPDDKILTAPLFSSHGAGQSSIHASKPSSEDSSTPPLQAKVQRSVKSLLHDDRGLIPCKQVDDNTSKTSAQHTQIQEILFVGQLIRGKGLDTLIDAMVRLPASNRLIVCGSGSMEQDYRDQVKRLGLSQRVDFVGRLNSAQLSRRYQQACLVAIPSRAPETFCLVGIEALLHGTPVVTSNVGGMRDWFKPFFNGLPFTANSVDELVSALSHITGNRTIHQQLVKNIEAEPYHQFSTQHHLSLLNQSFNQLLEA